VERPHLAKYAMLVAFGCILLFPSCRATQHVHPGKTLGRVLDGNDTVAVQLQAVLDDELEHWFPLCLDTEYGGYLSDLNYRWEPDGPQDKMIVTQARHIWSASNAAMFRHGDSVLVAAAAHGFRFLRDRMWDGAHGGFFELVDRRGDPVGEDGALIKTAYGNAFAIYGLAAYYKASGDTGALRLACRAFHWLEKSSYDTLYGGYFQFISREGAPLAGGYRDTPPKDQNSTIHLLESFTALYDVWPDSLLRIRLGSLLRLVRDTISTKEGYMHLFFSRDWTPVVYAESDAPLNRHQYEIDHISFGHDVETSYLMLDASEGLGIRDDTTTLRAAKAKVDFALRHGWDVVNGGLYDGGRRMPSTGRIAVVRETKEWWAQAEALNTFLMMSALFPHDSAGYFERFSAQWKYCRKYLVDTLYGGWYWGGLDKVPGNREGPKGTIWKAEYHTSRAMINCIRRLHNIFHRQARYDPVNRNATPGAKKLLAALESIAGSRIIAGHQNYVGKVDLYPERVRELTGKLPEIWGCDLAGYFRKEYVDELVQAAGEKYRAGYIITLMWHTGRPQDDPPFPWKESVQAKMTDEQWRELITPGTPLYTKWQNRVDSIALCLKRLQALGIPVLWRPFHEQNGVWFWWGNRKGPEGSARLYTMMYDRFVNVHHLDNLLWVWDTNTPRRLFDDEAYAYDDFFPGLDCVDVLAADVYHSDFKQSHHDELLELAGGKVIALGEVGEVPAPAVLALQPLWTWFMIWGDFVDTHNTPGQIRSLYADPRTLTHGDRLQDR
jgi:mannobiose 2-epimerase